LVVKTASTQPFPAGTDEVEVTQHEEAEQGDDHQDQQIAGSQRREPKRLLQDRNVGRQCQKIDRSTRGAAATARGSYPFASTSSISASAASQSATGSPPLKPRFSARK
jgi:hypothetical protein